MEGIAFGVRSRLETLGRASVPATELRVSGGGAGAAVWNQIKADVTGIPVVRVAVTWNPVDPARARSFVEKACEVRASVNA